MAILRRVGKAQYFAIAILSATITCSCTAALAEDSQSLQKSVTILNVQEDGQLVPSQLDARCVYLKPRCAKLTGSQTATDSKSSVGGPVIENHTDKENSISIEISGVAPLLRNELPTNEADALLVLQFKNEGSKTFFVPCNALACGKAAEMVTPKEFTPKHKVEFESGSWNCFGGQSARLHYNWSNESNTRTYHTVYLTQEKLTLSPNGFAYMVVQIKLPSSCGTYRLAITFDNRQLAQVHSGANNRLINQEYTHTQFIERSTNQTFKISMPSLDSKNGDD